MKIFLYTSAIIVIIATLAVAGCNALRITGSSDTFVTKEASEENWRKNEERWGANADLWNKQLKNNRQETARTEDHILAELRRHNEEFAHSPPVPDQSRSAMRRPFRPARSHTTRTRPAETRSVVPTPAAPLLAGLTNEQLAMLQEARKNSSQLNVHENRIAALESHEGPLDTRYPDRAEFDTLSNTVTDGFTELRTALSDIQERLATPPSTTSPEAGD